MLSRYHVILTLTLLLFVTLLIMLVHAVTILELIPPWPGCESTEWAATMYALASLILSSFAIGRVGLHPALTPLRTVFGSACTALLSAFAIASAIAIFGLRLSEYSVGIPLVSGALLVGGLYFALLSVQDIGFSRLRAVFAVFTYGVGIGLWLVYAYVTSSLLGASGIIVSYDMPVCALSLCAYLLLRDRPTVAT